MNTATFKSDTDINNQNSRHSDSEMQTGKHKEGPIAKAIEKQTTKLPSDTFLGLAMGAIGASLSFQLVGKKETSTFIGQWAPTLLILGLYNKLVKLQGSEPSNATA